MFYSAQVLARKGPLGIVWIAAHMDRQLRRNQITDAHIPDTVYAVMHPEAPLALRLSGQLLLGIVRLYNKQLTYLQQDCQDALIRIRVAVSVEAAAVTLPGEEDTTMLAAGGKRGSRAAQRAAASALQLEDDGAWGGVVDLVEAALLRATAAGPLDLQGGCGLHQGPAAALLRRATSSMPDSPSCSGRQSFLLLGVEARGATAGEGVGGKGGRGLKRGRGKENVEGVVGQWEEGGQLTPSTSRHHPSQQNPSQSLFGLVPLSLAPSRRGLGTASQPSQQAVHEDELFDAADGAAEALLYDLPEVEVERLREAPSASALRSGLQAQTLLRGLAAHSPSHSSHRRALDFDLAAGPGLLGTPTASAARQAAAQRHAAAGLPASQSNKGLDEEEEGAGLGGVLRPSALRLGSAAPGTGQPGSSAGLIDVHGRLGGEDLLLPDLGFAGEGLAGLEWQQEDGASRSALEVQQGQDGAGVSRLSLPQGRGGAARRLSLSSMSEQPAPGPAAAGTQDMEVDGELGAGGEGGALLGVTDCVGLPKQTSSGQAGSISAGGEPLVPPQAGAEVPPPTPAAPAPVGVEPTTSKPSQITIAPAQAIEPPPQAAGEEPGAALPPRPPPRRAAAAAAGEGAGGVVGAAGRVARRKAPVRKGAAAEAEPVMAALLGPPQSMSMDSAGDARAGEGGSVMRAADFRALMADRTPLLASRGLGAAAQYAKRQRMLPPGFISSVVLPGLVGLASPHSPAHLGVPASPLPYAQGPGSEGGASRQSQPLNLAALHAPSLQANYTADLLAVFQRTPAAAATATPDACLTTPRPARRSAAASPRSGGPRTLRSATALPLAAAATPLSPQTSQVPGASAGALQPSPAAQQQVAPRPGGAVPETPTVVTTAAAAGGQGMGLGLGAPAGSVSRSLDFPDMPPPTTGAPAALFDLDAAPGADPETALEADPGLLDFDAHPPHPTPSAPTSPPAQPHHLPDLAGQDTTYLTPTKHSAGLSPTAYPPLSLQQPPLTPGSVPHTPSHLRLLPAPQPGAAAGLEAAAGGVTAVVTLTPRPARSQASGLGLGSQLGGSCLAAALLDSAAAGASPSRDMPALQGSGALPSLAAGGVLHQGQGVQPGSGLDSTSGASSSWDNSGVGGGGRGRYLGPAARQLLLRLTLAVADTLPGGGSAWLSSNLPHILPGGVEKPDTAAAPAPPPSQLSELQVPLPVSQLTQGCTRIEASRCFTELLVLQSSGLVKMLAATAGNAQSAIPELDVMLRLSGAMAGCIASQAAA
ncbi:hypothetical protein QJQ45_029815 [Haematococcus lacustris]|nr:hypothetical protein QJQ45_029815 [Haematococcus lacustris]